MTTVIPQWASRLINQEKYETCRNLGILNDILSNEWGLAYLGSFELVPWQAAGFHGLMYSRDKQGVLSLIL
ncbi:hypothetical protein MUK42_35059 [Musa troglodytarum]|uniref:Uncharacterized protein n=1 Tax=Musa troglodytarum TaxID=320322 RepID=A0A9E7HSW8_9LILI|nr:hypothetical protein MUK42_35059 [Musa troglodytarum]